MKKSNKYGWLMAVILQMSLVAACGGGSSSGSAYDAGSGSGGVELTNEYSSPSELSTGDLMYINFDSSGEATIDFTGVSSSAKFMLVVGSADEAGASTSFQLASDLSRVMEEDVSAQVIEDEDYSANEILSTWLRAAEFDLAATEVPSFGKAVSVDASKDFKAVAVGDTESFRVLSSLTSTTTYTLVDAKARCIGDAVIFYVDTRVDSSLLSDAEISALCDEFDSVAQDEQDLLGDLSDVDGNGKLKVLMSVQINMLGQMGGGIITGYFWAGDLYERSGSNPVSNYGEIIYTMVPDPDGTYGVAVTKDFALSNLLPAVLPHELQHAISYNQHVFVNGTSPEQNWLNEGMSHLIEDLMGYGQENPSRYALFLANTSQGGVVTTHQPNLYERGASYLFLRFLYEQAADGNQFVRNLENSSSLGVENIEQAFNGSSGFSRFPEFLARWTAALALTDEGVTLDSRYIYKSRTMSAITNHWKGVCLTCDADDGRGTVLTGVSKAAYGGSSAPTVYGSAAKFYDITSVPSRITLSGNAGGSDFGVLIRSE